MTNQIPTERPKTPLLDAIEHPDALKKLSEGDLVQLANELRQFMLFSVGQTGGHLGAGLGVVELTIALLTLLETPNDHLIWDVGHQAYPHKILTGRREQMLHMRCKGGLTPFPDREESPYDCFGTGHSSTSISAALGMAIADQLQGREHRSVAVIGDGALTAGMAFEALNHAAHTQANLLVILNDNDMSISFNQGGLSTYLAKQASEYTPTNSSAPLFEALNFEYTGPIDGHDFNQLMPAINKTLNREGPQFLHVRTQKGQGFAPAVSDPVGFHAITKLESPKTQSNSAKTFSQSFSDWLLSTAAKDQRLIGITPAMSEGSGLSRFAEHYPDRYFDVAIAEQHAATFAAGLATQGMKPVLAIYSTFLQRAYDQVVHDLAVQNLDCLIAIDRAGLVGEDGPTHAGLFDISMLRTLPNALIMAPSSLAEQQAMLTLGYEYPGVAVVRYPRGAGEAVPLKGRITIAKANTIRHGTRIVILNFGPLLSQAQLIAERFDLTLVDMRFIKPLDEALLKEVVSNHLHIITIEDAAIAAGAGSAVSEWCHANNVGASITQMGVPDRWIEHATRAEQLKDVGLDSDSLERTVQALLNI